MASLTWMAEQVRWGKRDIQLFVFMTHDRLIGSHLTKTESCYSKTKGGYSISIVPPVSSFNNKLWNQEFRWYTSIHSAQKSQKGDR